MNRFFTIVLLSKLFVICLCQLHFGQEASGFDKKHYFIKSFISDSDKKIVFENFWETVNKSYFDSTFNGNDWAKLRETYYPQVIASKNKFELRDVLNRMLSELKGSHLKVNIEINLRKKVLNGMLGKGVDYKENIIVFGNGFSTRRIGNIDVVSKIAKNSGADENGIKRGWILKEYVSSPSFEQKGDEFIFKENWQATFLDENNAEKKVFSQFSWYLLPKAKFSLSSRKLDEKTLYLKFIAFDKDVSKWIEQQISQHPVAENLVIDLRGNYGGLAQELKKVLSLFFPPNTKVGTFIERDSDEAVLKVGSDNHFKKKLFVVIDDETASAAEIMAQAVKDIERGKVIGQKSSGQVLNSFEKNISNGFRLQIAFRDYKTIKGTRLEKIGVTPDIEIPFTLQDFMPERDVFPEKTVQTIRTIK